MEQQQIQLGAATVTILDVGELEARLEQWFTEPAPADRERFAQPIRIPIQCVHIMLPRMSILIDAASYDFPPDYFYLPACYQPPPGLVPQLAALGITAEAITHVILTHAHGDHFNGSTHKENGNWIPTFPKARHYLGRPDWESDQLQAALAVPTSLEARTLGVLHQQELLELVDGDHDLGGGVRLMATPGESPGHQIVRLSSRDETVYCTGDLYHHPVEIEQPVYMPWWADAEQMQQSRGRLIAAALREQARVIATHIARVGRIEQTPAGMRWSQQVH